MASSHDGLVWDFIPGDTVLRTASFGKWDGSCVFTFPNLVELPEWQLRLILQGVQGKTADHPAIPHGPGASVLTRFRVGSNEEGVVT